MRDFPFLSFVFNNIFATLRLDLVTFFSFLQGGTTCYPLLILSLSASLLKLSFSSFFWLLLGCSSFFFFFGTLPVHACYYDKHHEMKYLFNPSQIQEDVKLVVGPSLFSQVKGISHLLFLFLKMLDYLYC